MSLANLYPTIRPSLRLDFANAKALDPRITFTRATTARYYDGRTFAKAEENAFTRSQEFNQSAWTKGDTTVTADTDAAPDGTTTADTITATATTAVHFVSQSGTGLANPSGQALTFSVFLKAGTHSFVQFFHGSSSQTFADFNLSTGAVGTVGTAATATIAAQANGWYRCTMTVTPSAASSFRIALVSSSTAAYAESWTAAGTETALAWGAQVEQRSSVCAYAPTTTATVTNTIPALVTAAAGVARFDHDPVTGESLGLRVEGGKTNLLLQSEDFATTWTTTRASVEVNANVAPDGALTADRIVDDTSASNTHSVQQSVTKAAAAITYTFSCYAKSGGRSVRLSIDNGAGTDNVSATFDLTAGTATAASAGGTFTALFSSIQAVGNGWYRCSVTGTTDTGTTVRASVRLFDGTSATYTGNGYAHAYVWGAQLETGQTFTSYIPTTTASATRNADVATMTGGNFSSWWRNDEGTILLENNYDGGSNRDSGSRTALQIDDGGTSYRHLIYSSSSIANRCVVTIAGSTTGVIPGGPTSYASFVRTLYAFKAGSIASSYAGGAVASATPSTMPVVTQIGIGLTPSSGSQPNGCFKRLLFFPAKLTDAQLRALSQQ